MYEKLIFTDEAGEKNEFYIIEQTRVNNTDYLLVIDADEDIDGDDEVAAMIVKDISSPEDEEAIYEFVEDDRELDSVSKIFDELLDDVDIEK
jgi:uncharacterized protein YrzB (UPF0473 family)